MQTISKHARRALTFGGALFGLLLVVSQVAVATAAPSDVQAARIATARFHSVGQAAAAGYGPFPAGVPLHECIESLNDTGGMGVHYVNGALLDTTLDAGAPEVLVYAPDPDGKLKLVALEYVVFKEPWTAEHGTTRPQLFGVEFGGLDAPNRYDIPSFYALHAWIWNSNPSGIFADFNPEVACP
jgi:hypothetical protein